MPGWRPLVQDGEFWGEDSGINASYKGKYAEKYARLLVGVGTAKSGSQEVGDNKGWWGWAYRNLYKSVGAQGKFQNLKQRRLNKQSLFR